MQKFSEQGNVAAYPAVYDWLTSATISALLLLAREARGHTGQAFHDKAQGIFLLWTKLAGTSAQDADSQRLRELVDSIPDPS
jgi:hypothetical protein